MPGGKAELRREGDKDEADNYYYREMEAKRRQKSTIKRYAEVVPAQWILGYGVKPFRTFAVWGGVVAVFALYYWLVQALSGANSLWACLYFSIMTAITPGYGRFDIKPEMFLPVSIEAVFGAFMWVALITILARKFFRT